MSEPIETKLPQPDVNAWEHRRFVETLGVPNALRDYKTFFTVVAEPPSCLVDVDTESEL